MLEKYSIYETVRRWMKCDWSKANKHENCFGNAAHTLLLQKFCRCQSHVSPSLPWFLQQEVECGRLPQSVCVWVCVSFHITLWKPPAGAIGELTVPFSFMSLLESTFRYYDFLLPGNWVLRFTPLFLIVCSKYSTIKNWPPSFVARVHWHCTVHE